MTESTAERTETEFLRRRLEVLYRETLNRSRAWKTDSPAAYSTLYRVIVPEDGEDYEVKMVVSWENDRTIPPRTRWVLISYETGLPYLTGKYPKEYRLTSDEHPQVAQLGELVESQSQAQT